MAKKSHNIKAGTNISICFATEFYSRRARGIFYPKHRMVVKIRDVPSGAAGSGELDWKDASFKALKSTLEIEEGDNVWINYTPTRPGMMDSDLVTSAKCT